MIIKRILAPLDFSNSSSAAIDYAIGLALTQKAELILVHII
jgi:nucleotide-binding universal stress UspA family protein